MVSKNFSVCLSVTNFDPNYLGTGRTEWAEIFKGFLAGNNYPNLPHSQGGMKFATQISPLLNSIGYL